MNTDLSTAKPPFNISSLHINSVEKIRFAIFSKPHWLSQLQQATLYCQQYEEELLIADVSHAEMQAALEDEKISPAEVRLTEFRLQRHEQQRRDTSQLLSVAQAAVDQILTSVGDQIKGLTYEEVQERFAGEALLAQQARNYAAEQGSLATGISTSIIKDVLGMAPETRASLQPRWEAELASLGISLMPTSQSPLAASTNGK